MGKKDGKRRAKVVTDDARFAQVYNDPRFRAPKTKDLKVQIDDRFTKEEMSIGKKAKVDKYGRKIGRIEDEKTTFDKLYTKEGDEEVEEEAKIVEEESEESEESDLDDVMAKARGLVGSSSDSESEEEVESEEEEEDLVQEDTVRMGEVTNRFAVVNMDWDHVNSTDLYATFSSFVPKGGSIKNVVVYPSDYGRQKMQEEELEGPAKELFEKERALKELKETSDSESDSDEEIDIHKAAQKLYTEDEGIDYNSKALRAYQLQRLRYYYAVVTCDSLSTAKNIYDNVDGTEYESTANLFDLRFVADDMDFTDREPRDTCESVPSNYHPKSFTTDALRSSKVKLSWDETPADRIEMTTRNFSQKEVDDMDFKAYLASDSDEDEEELKNKYQGLKGMGSNIEKPVEEDDIDMEVTFTPGLGENGPVDEENMTTLQKYRVKQKERRKQRKERVKELKAQGIEEQKEDRKARKRHQVTDNGSDNEDDSDREHFNMKNIIKAEKIKSKKKKSHKDKRAEKRIGVIDEDITLDKSDDRFKEIFEDHEFAIDPTNPEFHKTVVMDKLMKEGKKWRHDSRGKHDHKKHRKN